MDLGFASEKLKIGEFYSRDSLAKQFQITDATLRNGVFRPKAYFSIWLFVTRNKPANRTQYVDKLAGDELHWQGQNAGRSDKLIIEHKARGLELLVFYRLDTNEPFRYEGIFEYVEHSGPLPTNFKLRRV
jgi:putative restriction endonuclease